MIVGGAVASGGGGGGGGGGGAASGGGAAAAEAAPAAEEKKEEEEEEEDEVPDWALCLCKFIGHTVPACMCIPDSTTKADIEAVAHCHSCPSLPALVLSCSCMVAPRAST